MEIDYNAELFVAGHIKTFTGIYFDALQPNLQLIRIEDIAHALSQTPRYGGHLPKFYSVAQHSLYVSKILPPALKLAGLLHDATEAYLCDIPSPFKHRMPEYSKIENGLHEAIMQRFRVYKTYLKYRDDIKAADTKALKVEWDVLMQGRPNIDTQFTPGGYRTMQTIERQFLQTFKRLFKG